MHGINVVYLDRDVRVYASLDVELHHAQLHLALLGAEEDDPVEAAATIEADHILIERPALVEPLGQDVRLDPLDAHPSIMPDRQGHSGTLA
jgi:hypothetical protein